MSSKSEDGVSGVKEVKGVDTRFCSECYATLMQGEKRCPHGHTAEIKTISAVTLGRETDTSVDYVMNTPPTLMGPKSVESY